MLQVFEYATGNGFWVFLGCALLAGIPFHGVAAIVRAWRWPPQRDDDDIDWEPGR